jgi:DMSO reductase anchor subunit
MKGYSMSQTTLPAATWKRVTASVLDVLTVFLGGGYLIGLATGSLTADGFNLTGLPALLLLGVIVLYFFVGRRVAGGTLWDRVLRISRPQPN